MITMMPADPQSRVAHSTAQVEAVPPESIDLDYRSMPPKASIPMSVELEVRGRGKPLPFPLDDDVAE